jgi:hypothetical protein
MDFFSCEGDEKWSRMLSSDLLSDFTEKKIEIGAAES